MKAQKQFNELKKQLESITAVAEDGDVKVYLKGSIAMYTIDKIEINGEEVKNLNKAVKKANKDLNKILRKKFKNGEVDMAGMGM